MLSNVGTKSTLIKLIFPSLWLTAQIRFHIIIGNAVSTKRKVMLVVVSNEFIVENCYSEETLNNYFLLLLLNFRFIGSKYI